MYKEKLKPFIKTVMAGRTHSKIQKEIEKRGPDKPVSINIRDIKPIFIIGAPRSGTSITTWMLGQHPNIQPMPETGWIAGMAVGSQLAYWLGSARGRYSHLSNVEYPDTLFHQRIGEAVDAIVHDVFAQRCERLYGNDKAAAIPGQNKVRKEHALHIRRSPEDPKARWIDGTPLNTRFVSGLGNLFHQAMFLHLIRRPQEVAASLMNFEKAGGVSQSAEEALATWHAHTEKAFLAERALGKDRVLRVHYQDLTAEPERTIRGILAFLDEEWASDCLIPFQQRINSSKVDQLREEIEKKLRGKKSFKAAEALYEEILAHETPEEPDQEAEEALRKAFMDLCLNKLLVS